MELEVSLPHSQSHEICPYPEPDKSSLCLPILIFEDSLQYYTFIYV